MKAAQLQKWHNYLDNNNDDLNKNHDIFLRAKKKYKNII